MCSCHLLQIPITYILTTNTELKLETINNSSTNVKFSKRIRFAIGNGFPYRHFDPETQGLAIILRAPGLH